MTIDKIKMEQMRNDINIALTEIAKKHGVHMELKNGRYSDNTFNFKLEGGVTNSDGSTVTKESEAFKLNAEMFGLSPENLFSTTTINGEQYKIMGLKTKNHKYPIITRNIKTGKTYKMPATMVKTGLD